MCLFVCVCVCICACVCLSRVVGGWWLMAHRPVVMSHVLPRCDVQQCMPYGLNFPRVINFRGFDCTSESTKKLPPPPPPAKIHKPWQPWLHRTRLVAWCRPGCTCHLPTTLDVHVISPLQQQMLREAASTPGHALQVGTRCKLTSHQSACRSVGVKFIPLVVEALHGRSYKRHNLHHPHPRSGHWSRNRSPWFLHLRQTFVPSGSHCLMAGQC